MSEIPPHTHTHSSLLQRQPAKHSLGEIHLAAWTAYLKGGPPKGNTADIWRASPHTFLQTLISHAQFHSASQSFSVISFEFALRVISLEHKRPLLCWLKCYVKSYACHVCTCDLTHFWCALFFLQSKRSSTEINGRIILSPLSFWLKFWEFRAPSGRIFMSGPFHSQFDSMKKNLILKNSAFSKSQPLACKDCNVRLIFVRMNPQSSSANEMQSMFTC